MKTRHGALARRGTAERQLAFRAELDATVPSLKPVREAVPDPSDDVMSDLKEEEE
jgi:hypothetical protein